MRKPTLNEFYDETTGGFDEEAYDEAMGDYEDTAYDEMRDREWEDRDGTEEKEEVI